MMRVRWLEKLLVTRKSSLATKAARLTAWTGVIALGFSLVTYCSQVYPRHDLQAVVTESFAVPAVTSTPAIRLRADGAIWNDGHVDELVTDAGFFISNCSSGLSKDLHVYFVAPEKRLGPIVISQGGKLSWSLDGTFEVQRAVSALGAPQPQDCRTSTPSGSFLIYVVVFALQPGGRSTGIPLPVQIVDLKELSQALGTGALHPIPVHEYWNRPVRLVPGDSSVHVDPLLFLEELNRNKADDARERSGGGKAK